MTCFERKPMQRVHVTVITQLRSAGTCDKAPIQKSPWTLPINKRNQKLKLEYCRRQMKLLVGWHLSTGNTVFADAVHIWQQRINWIKENQL